MLGIVGYKTGLPHELFSHSITLQPKAQPGIVDSLVTVNEALRGASPFAACAALATSGLYYARQKTCKKDALINRVSKIKYSGVDNMLSDEEIAPKNSVEVVKQKTRNFGRGSGVATLAVLLTGATSGIEHEVSNGPLRPINAMYELIAPNSVQRSMLVQSENNTFMDDSVIDRDTIDSFTAQAARRNIEVVPFGKKLLNIDGKSGLEISIPISRFEAISRVNIDASCETIPVIVDETVGKKPGQTVDINGSTAQVVGVVEDIAHMNRNIAIVSDRDMKQCLEDGTDESYFGAIIPDQPSSSVEQLAAKSPELKAVAIDQSHVKASNRKFWRANGTPILLPLIAYVGLFGGFAASAAQRSALRRDVREIGMLNAQGVDMKTINHIEDRRALRETNKAALIAAPLMPLVAGAFNIAEIGLKVGVGLRELSVGYVVALSGKVIGSRRAVKKMKKDMDLGQAVKG